MTGTDRDAWAKLWKRCASSLFWRLDCEQHGHKEAVKSWNKHQKENTELRAKLAKKDTKLDQLQSTVDTMLEILMASSEAARISAISKIKKRNKSGRLLASIRKANKDGS